MQWYASFARLYSFTFFRIVSDTDDLDDFFFVQVFEALTRQDLVVILFYVEQTCLLQALAIELIRILKDLRD